MMGTGHSRAPGIVARIPRRSASQDLRAERERRYWQSSSHLGGNSSSRSTVFTPVMSGAIPTTGPARAPKESRLKSIVARLFNSSEITTL